MLGLQPPCFFVLPCSVSPYGRCLLGESGHRKYTCENIGLVQMNLCPISIALLPRKEKEMFSRTVSIFMNYFLYSKTPSLLYDKVTCKETVLGLLWMHRMCRCLVLLMDAVKFKMTDQTSCSLRVKRIRTHASITGAQRDWFH